MTDVAAARTIIGRTKLTDDSATVAFAEKGQGITYRNDFSQLDEKSVENLCRVLCRPRGSIMGGPSNNGIAVLVMAETNLQGVLYFINHHTRFDRTYNYANVALTQVGKLYHQNDMEKSKRYPNVVPDIASKDWSRTLETVVEYIRGFCGLYGHPLSYCFRGDLVPTAEITDTTVDNSNITYFSCDE